MDGIVTRRNIEEGETAVVGTMNNAGSRAADDRRHVGARSRGRGGRDRHPDGGARPGGQGHDRRGAGPHVPRPRDRDRQQPDPGVRRQSTGQRQATNFKVVITIDEEVPDVRPGFTCTAEITTATRKSVVCRADPGADRARDAVRCEGPAGPRAAAAAPARRRRADRSRLDRAAARPHPQGNRGRVPVSATARPCSRRSRSASPASVLRGALGLNGRRPGDHRAVRVGARARPTASRSRSSRRPAATAAAPNADSSEPDPRVGLHRAAGHLGEQAAVVHDRARQHRRGHVDRDGRVADPGHERDGLDRHRRQTSAPTRSRSSACRSSAAGRGRGADAQQPADHAATKPTPFAAFSPLDHAR